MALKTDYKDFIPPEDGKKYRLTANSDGSTKIEDITQYVQEGDSWGAGDVNAANTLVNQLVDGTTPSGKAEKLYTERTIALSGGATGTATGFDGSANITIPVTGLDMSKATAGTLPVARGGTGATSLGNITVGTSQHLSMTDYARPIEIGQYVDMHRVGSEVDYNVRLELGISTSPYIIIRNVDLPAQNGAIICGTNGAVLCIQKITQAGYNALQSKDPGTVYLITG